jgi:mannose-6-phosphate isomerase-like protein (cupin superfamily)
MRGEGTMVISDERRDVGPGDLVYIPPDAVHSLETVGDVPIHCFCFAVGVEGAGAIDYTTH